MDKKNFWWFEKKYSKDEIDQLIKEIKVFNAGAIDVYLSNHVDKVYKEWMDKLS